MSPVALQWELTIIRSARMMPSSDMWKGGTEVLRAQRDFQGPVACGQKRNPDWEEIERIRVC